VSARTHQLFLGACTVAASPVTLYTVAAGFVVIVKSVVVFNDSAGTLTANSRLQPSGGTARRIWTTGALATQTGILWLPSLVMAAGDTLALSAVTNTANVIVSGSVLNV
jgi:hypothetical protein